MLVESAASFLKTAHAKLLGRFQHSPHCVDLLSACFAAQQDCQKCKVNRSFPCANLQVPGHMFVIGDADCGQFGLGEDEMSAPRPRPTDIAGKQVDTAKLCSVVLGWEPRLAPPCSWLSNKSGPVCAWQRLAQSCIDGVHCRRALGN